MFLCFCRNSIVFLCLPCGDSLISGKGLYMTPADMAIMWDDSMNAAVQMYAQDNAQFLVDFGVCPR